LPFDVACPQTPAPSLSAVIAPAAGTSHSPTTPGAFQVLAAPSATCIGSPPASSAKPKSYHTLHQVTPA